MEVGASTRASVPQGISEVPRVQAKAPVDAVRTELPAEKAVRQASQAPAVSDTRATTSADAIDRNLSIDIETQKVVFKAVDERTGEVLVQFPDPRYLKAYLDQKRAAESDARAHAAQDKTSLAKTA